MNPAAGPEPELPDPDGRQWTGFWCMIAQQTQNAFNDKAAQFLLVPLAGAVGATLFHLRIEDAAGIMIALPFVLFAPIAGWVSDRFSKRNVMIGAAIAQLAILIGILTAVTCRQMTWALVGFFALAVQSAFYGPAKVGITKELVGSRHIGFGAGVQQMTSMLAMLVGQIAMGFLFDHRYMAAGGNADAAWNAASGPLWVLMLGGIPAIALAWIVPRTPAYGAEPLQWSTTVRHFIHLKDLWSDGPMRLASLGIAFFWGFAAFLNLWAIKIAAELTQSGEGFGTLQSWFMAAAGIGMAAGFGVASWLLRRRIELGWVPVAGVLMTLFAGLLAGLDPRQSLDLLTLGPSAALHTTFLGVMTLLAFFAALFLAPLNAWIQDRYPAAKRGELQSAVNLQDCLAGILAVVIIKFGGSLLKGMDPLAALRTLLLFGALGCGAITLGIIRLLPAHFARVIGLSIVRSIYRIRAVDDHHLPREGGVLMLPNHVSWADAFFLTAASPRPVRFVMDATYMQYAPVRWFCTLFHTVPISLGKPREALKIAATALANGDVVCLFPEGQLTRTGTLQALQRGCELIARQGGAPVVPVWMDGAWGSIFSFERNCFFRKLPRSIPYGIGIAFGAPIPPSEARLERIQRGLFDASAAAHASRLPGWRKHPAAQANGYQLGQINGLPRETPFARLAIDPTLDSLPALAEFSHQFHAEIVPQNQPDETPLPHWVGGEALRTIIQASGPTWAPRVFFDFGENAHLPLDTEGWTHCPCLAIRGVIVAMSFPDPPVPYPGSKQQLGHAEGRYGPLLPGFSLSADRRQLSGPATGHHPLELPTGIEVDLDGWLVRSPVAPSSP
ncbi:acyl-[acyl-carrier-protein]-phospholipid O-acyltransferase/long-chain-fatty-acid--[acyl-carrier-protein] ligase [Haloferula luteola]|uniref:Acyl-[acyl-carrier-protein]-phospholipid O-acyltransferase/long-chain-fatty-acid--[acyl-carrier-protein] ligase n=1 Tax=Haloferula luteola TaxID=595692 RepID=A0A840UWU5_9BACT|nr:MFS transporter [Haloferula luteola]MBB5350252.1 acyl-[acyl-carrier-protein]-phospholipid O-acyltransferase/long-chain-fatty-acid--[acyl-carrier-protein] ligase [Haloferula luteola]